MFMCTWVHISVTQAQNQFKTWYFGNNAGINFNNSPPTPLTDGKVNTREGCATISDKDGNLLFSTDGRVAYNRKHEIMPNGSDLHGNSTSTQSAVIVQKPGSDVVYALFTLDHTSGSYGLLYSEVDMTLQSGYGDIGSVKNVEVTTNTCEKLVAVKHADNQRFWIIVHLEGSNRLLSYLLDENGISTTPIVTDLGSSSNYPSSSCIGYMKCNAEGTIIASANYAKNNVEIFKFNNSTGKLSSIIDLSHPSLKFPYGVEFSPNGKYLYVSEARGNGSSLYQYDIQNYNLTSITNSQVYLGSNSNYFGATQLGPDGRIYVARYADSYLGVISNPNAKGGNCDFKLSGFWLGGRTSFYGLPTFYNQLVTNIIAGNSCQGDSNEFTVSSSLPGTLTWDFGDPSSGSGNTATGSKVYHVFNDTGNYRVRLVAKDGPKTDTFYHVVKVSQVPYFNLGEDRLVCKSDSIKLITPYAQYTSVWQDTIFAKTLIATESGDYTLRLSSEGCSWKDTIHLEFNYIPPYDIKDTAICLGDTFFTFIPDTISTFRWSNGSTDTSLALVTGGDYWVDRTLGGCLTTDTFHLRIKILPAINMEIDTFLCFGDSLTFDLPKNMDSYLWSNGESTSSVVLKDSGTYWCRIENEECISSDTFHIYLEYKPQVNFGPDSTVCVGDETNLKVVVSNGQILWHNSSSDDVFNVTQNGTFWVELTNACGSVSDTISLQLDTCRCISTIPNSFTPNLDGLNEIFRPVLYGCEMEKYSFQIFNRWGERLFSTEDPNAFWDGTYNDKNVPAGLYVYVLNYATRRQEVSHLSGEVHILR